MFKPIKIKKGLLALTIINLFTIQSCNDDDDNPSQITNNTDDIFELAVRKINSGVTIPDFTTARDTFVTELMKQEGTSNDREFQPFFDFSGTLEMDSIYIGMTQYENLETYQSISQTLGTTSIATDFFSKFTPLAFEPLQPLDNYKPIDLRAIAPLNSSKVIEIAVRDISLYSNFNQTDYETKRDAFLSKLSQQSGFSQEIQWQSVTNNNIVVGMTVYDNQTAAQTILSNANFNNSSEVINFLGSYPPNIVATINTVLK